MIPEPKRFHALLRQKLLTDLVAANPFRQAMLKSIQFNGQLRIGAVKIQNVPTNRVLPTEFEAGEASSAQCAPKFFLFVGLVATKFAGRIAAIRVDEGDRVRLGQVVARMDGDGLSRSAVRTSR